MNNIVPEGVPVVGAWIKGPVLIFPNEARVEIFCPEVTKAKAALIRASLPVNGPQPHWTAEQRDVYQDVINNLNTKYLNRVAARNAQFGVHFDGQVLQVNEGRFAA